MRAEAGEESWEAVSSRQDIAAAPLARSLARSLAHSLTVAVITCRRPTQDWTCHHFIIHE